VIAGLVLLAALAPRPGSPPPDLVDLLLADEDYEASRETLLATLRQSGAPCERLDRFASNRNERVREHAVRALADAGCNDFSAYRSYLEDPSPWVQRGVFDAAERLRIGDAIPFMVRRLTDPRLMLSDAGSLSVGEAAHRALRALSCQSFHFDPHGPHAGQVDAAAQWTSWYAEHGGEPREKWVAEGIALAHDYLSRDFTPHRVEGLELLALIGSPALPALREGFARGSGDLKVTLSCSPEEPPRVLDRVPCALEVVNLASRRVALAPAPGDPATRLRRIDAAGFEGPPSRPSREGGGVSDRGPSSGEGRGGGAAAVSRIAGSIIDLVPGQVLRREFTIGPVSTAGRYEITAILPDRAGALWDPGPVSAAETPPSDDGARSTAGRSKTRPGGKPEKKPGSPAPSVPPSGRARTAGPPPIEATTVLRFEQ
jgi:hypothetical protein